MLYTTRFKFSQLLDLYREVVREPGLAVSMSRLARRFSTSVPTIKSVLAAIEGI